MENKEWDDIEESVINMFNELIKDAEDFKRCDGKYILCKEDYNLSDKLADEFIIAKNSYIKLHSFISYSLSKITNIQLEIPFRNEKVIIGISLEEFKSHFELITREEMRKIKIDSLLEDEE